MSELQPNGQSATHPVFIVGAPRSGTTLLRALLAANPGLSIPPESHFVSYLYKRYESKLQDWTPALTRRLALDIAADAHFREWGLDPARTVEHVLMNSPDSFSATIAGFFSAYAAEEGKQRWGDKTPHYVFFHRELKRLFPSLYLIHVIRDGRDVACSHLAFSRGQWRTWTARSVPAAAAWWKASILAGRDAARELGPQYMEVRYEDLTARTEAALREVCAFTSLEYDERMLEYAEVVRIPRTSPYGRPFERVRRGLEGPARDWRTELSAPQAAAFEAVAATELLACNYPLSGERRSRAGGSLARLRARLFMARRNALIFIRHTGHRHATPLARLRQRARRRGRRAAVTHGSRSA